MGLEFKNAFLGPSIQEASSALATSQRIHFSDPNKNPYERWQRLKSLRTLRFLGLLVPIAVPVIITMAMMLK